MEHEPRFPSLFFRQRLNATVLPMLGGIFLFLLLPRAAAMGILALFCSVILVFAFLKTGEWRKTLLCFLAGLSLSLVLMGVGGLEKIHLEKMCHTPYSSEGYVLAKVENGYDVYLCRVEENLRLMRVRVETDAEWKVGEKRSLTLAFHSPQPKGARDEGVKLLAYCRGDGGVIGKSHLYSFVGEIRENLRTDFSARNNGGFLTAVLLGDRSGLTKGQNDAFCRTATNHILAVSGLHVAQTISFLFCLLGVFPIPRQAIRLLLFPFIIVLYLLTGAGVSVFRACVMTLFALAGILLRRRTDPTTALCFSAAILVFVNPYALESPSFLLSYASTFGITTCGIPLCEFMSRRFTRKGMYPIFKWLQSLILSFAISVVSFVFTVPVQLILFGTVSPFAPVYSILLVPLFQLSLILALLGACAIPLLPDVVSSLFLQLSATFPELVEFMAKGASAPMEMGDFSKILGASLIVFLFVFFRKKAPVTTVFLLQGILIVFFGVISLFSEILA